MMRMQYTILKRILILLMFSGGYFAAWSQNSQIPVAPPEQKDYLWILSFLSSDWLEGRETGTEGNQLAGDFIANIMRMNGLEPYGDLLQQDQAGNGQYGRSWFQEFNVSRYHADTSFLYLHSNRSRENLPVFTPESYTCFPPPFSIQSTAGITFAGYGLKHLQAGYNDYAAVRCNNRIVVVLDGYPGQQDTTSNAWKIGGKYWEETGFDPETKVKIAQQEGAVALIILTGKKDSALSGEVPYSDDFWKNEKDTTVSKIPVFVLNPQASRSFLNCCNLDSSGIVQTAGRLISPAKDIPDIQATTSVSVYAEPVPVRNVLGILRAENPVGNILIGAHYDHLGKRNKVIYNGADDNASGVAGMLTLAQVWSKAGLKIPYNLIFAAWTGEEKGLLGSSYFVDSRNPSPPDYLLALNMDMISRSAPEDSTGRVVSIGTRPSAENIRTWVKTVNDEIKPSFHLDLWDVTGHTGSDYAPFLQAEIPVMTVFSGFHSDYHTEFDDAERVDLQKMGRILNLVNRTLIQVMESQR